MFSLCTGNLCAVQACRAGCEHPADLAALHLPGPDLSHGMVLRLSLCALCNVQKGARTSKF